jgi:hypothetical protein
MLTEVMVMIRNLPYARTYRGFTGSAAYRYNEESDFKHEQTTEL